MTLTLYFCYCGVQFFFWPYGPDIFWRGSKLVMEDKLSILLVSIYDWAIYFLCGVPQNVMVAQCKNSERMEPPLFVNRTDRSLPKFGKQAEIGALNLERLKNPAFLRDLVTV